MWPDENDSKEKGGDSSCKHRCPKHETAVTHPQKPRHDDTAQKHSDNWQAFETDDNGKSRRKADDNSASAIPAHDTE